MKNTASKRTGKKQNVSPSDKMVNDSTKNPLISQGSESGLRDGGRFLTKPREKRRVVKGEPPKEGKLQTIPPIEKPSKATIHKKGQSGPNSRPPRIKNGGFADADKMLIAFGKRLRAIRKEKKLSLRELSYRCGVDNSKIAKIEKGQVNLTALTLFQIWDGLSITPVQFWTFGGEWEVDI